MPVRFVGGAGAVGGGGLPTLPQTVLPWYRACAGKVLVIGLRSEPKAGQVQDPKKDGVEV